jgi:Protein of unknown function (DUF2800)
VSEDPVKPYAGVGDAAEPSFSSRQELPSASGVDMALVCVGSWTLPSCRWENPEAALGTVFHSFVEAWYKRGHEAALAEAPADDRDWLKSLNLDPLPRNVESEVPLGWHAVTDDAVRYDLNGEHRAYPADGYYHGTADIVGLLGDDAVLVADLKRFGGRKTAEKSGQLAMLALAACRLTGRDRAVVMHLAPKPGGWRVDRAELDGFDLEAWAARFRRLAERLSALQPGRLEALTAGDHCTYCPSLVYCPAQASLVRQFSAVPPETLSERISAVPDEEAGALWEQVTLAEKLVEKAKKSLQMRATQRGIPLPSGKVLCEVRWTETVKSDTAKAEIKALEAELAKRGEITKQSTTQIRAVVPK